MRRRNAGLILSIAPSSLLLAYPSYAHTVAAVTQAHLQFEDNNVPYRRPDDYFAEMLKTDAHMYKVRASLPVRLSFRLLLSRALVCVPYVHFIHA